VGTADLERRQRLRRTLGDFKSESFAMGPGFVWIPKAGGGRLTVLGKWMHDFSAENRFESD
jgi:hypothetical protein